MDQNRSAEFDNFIRTVRLDELFKIATNHRGGSPCVLGRHTIGGFNVVYELVFLGNVVWMARIPPPYNCFQAEDVSASYAAMLKYLKRYSTIPVPTVFAYCLYSSSENKVNATYILMEQLPGHQLAPLERKDFDPDPEDLALARKLHQQLADVILQLASLKFSEIGSLREDLNGNSFVGPYVGPSGTAYPKHRAAVYKALSSRHKGPFTSVPDWSNVIAELKRKSALQDPEEESDRDITVAEYEILAELSDNIIVEKFRSGTLVIDHIDLTARNILVDGEFNITGILDFLGTTVPLASLCVFPWLFSANIAGLVTVRDAYLDVFLNRECCYPSSALRSCELRNELMQSAQERQSFELGLIGPYTSLSLPKLLKQIHNRPFDSDVEYQRIADTREWFKESLGGVYSWQIPTHP